MVAVISRGTWGARSWATEPVAVPPSRRTHFLVHHDGGVPVTRTGYAIPQAIDAAHHAKGWAGIGYQHVVSQAGDVYEGRGWGLVGAHCQGFNTVSFGVQVAVGGDQKPTPAALRTTRALYDEACDRAGKRLIMSWHGAHYLTECPGPQLIAWVRAGMPTTASPAAAAPVRPEDNMPTVNEISAEIWGVESTFVVPLGPGSKGDLVLADGRPALSPISTLAQTLYGVQELVAASRSGRPPVDVDALAAAIVARLPAGVTVDPQAVARAVVRELGAALGRAPI